MNLSATKLNSTYNEMVAHLGKPSYSLDFWSGETAVALSIIAKKIIPFSKVAILYSRESFEKFGKTLTDNLKQNGNSVISVVMPESFSDTLQDYSDIFNLAEDVRLIVTLDEKFYSLCKYFASLRQIECVTVVRNLNCYNILSSNIFIKNFDLLESVKISAKGHILFDYKEIERDKQGLSTAYAYIVSHSLALVDFRINALLTGKTIDKKVYDLASNAIKSAYSLFANKKEEFFDILTQDLFNLEIANLFADNNLYSNFSANFVARANQKENYVGNLLLASTLIAKILSLYCSDKYNKLLKSPNYLERAEYISNLLEANHADITKRINQNYNLAKNSALKGGHYLKRMQRDVDSFIKCSGVMVNTFTALGGLLNQKSQSLSQMIKHSGDIALNAMTIIRESGITEFI